MRAKCEGMYEEEAWHLLQSDQLNPAHKIILQKIAPEYIVAGMCMTSQNRAHSLVDIDVISELADWLICLHLESAVWCRIILKLWTTAV